MDQDAIALFRELADRSPSEREAYYVQQQVPAAVRDEVESLLRFDDKAVDSLAGHVASAAVKALFGSPQPQSPTTSSTSTSTNRQPVVIGRYQVVRLLGRGGMAEVYLARDPVLDRDIAVKLIAGGLDDDAARTRLVREARAAGRLRHPNIVTIFDAGEHGGRSYIAMEYVPGDTLRSLIRRRVALPLTRRLELIEGACAGLAHAHRAGVVHLDIKPDNLMVDDIGVVKVLDFGIARVLQGESLATRHLAGTLRYMSPEQIAGRPLDRRSDVFSLGCSFFELVAYSPAYVGSTQEIVTRITAGPVPLLIDAIPDIDPRLDAIARRAMALDPTNRYDDLEELRGELGRLRDEIDTSEDARFAQPIPIVSETASTTYLPVAEVTPRRASSHTPSRSSTLAPRASADRRRFGLAASIAAVGALAVGVASFLMFRPPNPESRTANPESRISSAELTAPILTPPPSESARPSEPVVTKETTANEEVWRRLARGDRDGVIQLLRSPAPARGATQGGQLAAEVFEAQRATVVQARQRANATSRAVSSEPYRSAEERFARATRLEADGRAIEALGALWQAADLYAQSVAIDESQQPRTPPSLAQGSSSFGPARSSEPASSPSSEPAPGPGRIALPQLQPATEVPRPEPAPPPAVETKSVERAPAAIPEPPKASRDAEAIRDVLRRYQAAYQLLDISRVQQVFPSLGRDQVEQLRRTFAGMTAYEIEIRNARVDVQGDMATVQAVVARRMVPRVGKPVANEVETAFRFRRDGAGWVITVVTVQ